MQSPVKHCIEDAKEQNKYTRNSARVFPNLYVPANINWVFPNKMK